MKFQKSLLQVFFATLLLILAGCSTTSFVRIAPPLKTPENASGIYTFSFQWKSLPTGLVKGSAKAYLVINGESYLMEEDPNQAYVFLYDYQMPPFQNEAVYYFKVEYKTNIAGSVRDGEEYSATEAEETLHRVRIVSRYPIQLVSNRGPVGANITLVGRGFTPYDKIVLGDREAATTFESSTSLRFTVPQIPSGETYPVKLRTGQGDIEAGTFRVDASTISVMPQKVQITTGGAEVVIFTINMDAPEGGLLIDVTTDIPESVIMPEVVLPAGSRTVSVKLEGGRPGEGSLYVEASGFNPLTVPVTVQ